MLIMQVLPRRRGVATTYIYAHTHVCTLEILKNDCKCRVLHLTVIFKKSSISNGLHIANSMTYTYSEILKEYRGYNVIKVLFNRTKQTELHTIVHND